ncbi:hypothetical protein [Enterobacter sp. P82]|uniref:hypothetical protein n=1 Tax=Enterobacter sp. P82 TaxID=3123033 RepID=UPI00300D4881
MPYKHNLMNVLVMLFTNPPEALRILAFMFAGGFIRWCMGADADADAGAGVIAMLKAPFQLV